MVSIEDNPRITLAHKRLSAGSLPTILAAVESFYAAVPTSFTKERMLCRAEELTKGLGE